MTAWLLLGKADEVAVTIYYQNANAIHATLTAEDNIWEDSDYPR